MIKYLLLIQVLLITNAIKGIGQIDSTALYESAKFLVIAEKGIRNSEAWQAELSKNVVVRSLNSNGFSKTRFLLIQYRTGNITGIPDSSFKNNDVAYCCDYIVAFYGGIFFRLKGFVNNDFYNYITEFSETSDIGFNLRLKTFASKNIQEFKKLAVKNNLFIEDIDLTCLFNYYSVQAEAYKKLNKSSLPCIGSCVIKDRKRPYKLTKN